MDNDPELKEWASDWQAGHEQADSRDAMRQYTRRRGRFLAAWMFSEFVIGGIALPLLAYIGWAATDSAERLAMTALTSLTIGTMWFSAGSWSRAIDSSARTTTEFVALSVRRLHHMRQAWQIGWGLLATEVIVFSIWIWSHFLGGGRSHSAVAEQFAWWWLAGVTAMAVVYLIASGRGIAREATRFESLRRDLE